ncbi:MAG: hypothetical protein V3S37_01750, partial [Dehalococcoidia bacterium]
MAHFGCTALSRTMGRHLFPIRTVIIWLLIVILSGLVLGACGQDSPTATPGATPTRIPTATPLPSPASTSVLEPTPTVLLAATPSATPTFTPTSTKTPTSTPTATPEIPSCIPSGDHSSIQSALTDVGSKAILCPSAVFELSDTVFFTHDNQEIYTQDFPRDD